MASIRRNADATPTMYLCADQPDADATNTARSS